MSGSCGGYCRREAMMASMIRKLFKRTSSESRRSEDGGCRRKNGSGGGRSTDSPTHRSAAIRFFGRCSSPRIPRRDASKVSPQDTSSSDGVSGGHRSSPSSLLGSNSPSRSVRFKSSKTSPRPSRADATSKNSQTVRTRRLMKELHEITKRTRSLEKPPFVVELVDDNLFEWNIKLFQIDPESDFYQDMQEVGISYVLLNMVFPDNFPFSPPFMRVISPHVEKGFVMEGGAICMELLTPRGWASAYTIEAVVMQFAASLVKGQGRIARKCKSGKEFSRKSAEASFRSLVKTHEKYGWVTPPLADG